MTSGLGGLNKSPNGVVVGVVQLQLPVVETQAQLAAQTERVVELVGKARRNMSTMDLVVFPEYCLHGLSMSTDDAIMCDVDGAEVRAFKEVCHEHAIWGCFSIMERNPAGNPYNVGIIIDAHGELALHSSPCMYVCMYVYIHTDRSTAMYVGELVLYYRKLHPWTPVEPWEPGNVGIPVCSGPKGCKLALIICHDGQFPECAREAAYKGAELMIRTAGYTAPIRASWRFTNQANAFHNLMATASVCMCGSDSSFDSWAKGWSSTSTGRCSRTAPPAAPTRSSRRRCGPTSSARHASTGASRTTSTSSATAGSSPCAAARPTARTRS